MNHDSHSDNISETQTAIHMAEIRAAQINEKIEAIRNNLELMASQIIEPLADIADKLMPEPEEKEPRDYTPPHTGQLRKSFKTPRHGKRIVTGLPYSIEKPKPNHTLPLRRRHGKDNREA